VHIVFNVKLRCITLGCGLIEKTFIEELNLIRVWLHPLAILEKCWETGQTPAEIEELVLFLAASF